MNNEIITAIANYFISAAPIALFVAICQRCVRILVRVLGGKEELL